MKVYPGNRGKGACTSGENGQLALIKHRRHSLTRLFDHNMLEKTLQVYNYKQLTLNSLLLIQITLTSVKTTIDW